MAKEMVYFNATKQIETLTIHYNNKLDGTFVDEVCVHIKEIAKKMKGVNLKNPKEFESIQVFVYPSKKLFYKVFAGEIEKRFYSRRRSIEDLYVVRDSEGNIHIVSPRGMSTEKIEAFKKILVMKVLGEYMEDKQKQSAERLLREAVKPKEEEKEEEIDEEEIEQLDEPEELDEEELDEVEQEAEELAEEELDEMIEAEQAIEQIDDEEAKEKIEQETARIDDEEVEESKEESEEANKKPKTKSEAQEWLSLGWIAYVKGKLRKEKDIKRFADNISKTGVKKLGKLSDSKWYESYNYSEEYACAIVEYVVVTYGMKKFVEFYQNPKDIQGVFGVSKFVFDNQVKAYIYSRYTDKQMKMEMDQRAVSEITEVHFAKSGGANITIDKEIQIPEEPQVKEKI